MADQGFAVNIEAPQGWAVRPVGDGAHTALVFNMRSGPIGIALDHNSLSRFVERILQEIADSTATETPAQPHGPLAAMPVPSTSMGFFPHPHDPTSGIVSFGVGQRTLSFQVDASTLVQFCNNALAAAQSRPADEKH